MKLPIIGILSGVALATIGISSAAQAAILIPPPGVTQYRLVFVTDGTRNASSADIADYNTFVNNAVTPGSPLGTALTTAGFGGINWTAIASTAAVNVRVNTSTQGTGGVPIYLVDGTKVANNYGDLWDGTILAPINRTELDTIKPTTGAGAQVWTGSSQLGATLNPLGTSNPRRGNSGQTGAFWMSEGAQVASNQRALYAISGIITVPEPSMLLSFITLGGLVLGGAVRGVRK